MRKVVELILNIHARGGEEVDENTLLDEIVLTVDVHVLNLLLRGDKPLQLALLRVVRKLVTKGSKPGV